MRIFTIILTSKSEIRNKIKDLLIWQGQEDISSKELDKLTEQFIRS